MFNQIIASAGSPLARSGNLMKELSQTATWPRDHRYAPLAQVGAENTCTTSYMPGSNFDIASA